MTVLHPKCTSQRQPHNWHGEVFFFLPRRCVKYSNMFDTHLMVSWDGKLTESDLNRSGSFGLNVERRVLCYWLLSQCVLSKLSGVQTLVPRLSVQIHNNDTFLGTNVSLSFAVAMLRESMECGNKRKGRSYGSPWGAKRMPQQKGGAGAEEYIFSSATKKFKSMLKFKKRKIAPRQAASMSIFSHACIRFMLMLNRNLLRCLYCNIKTCAGKVLPFSMFVDITWLRN